MQSKKHRHARILAISADIEHCSAPGAGLLQDLRVTRPGTRYRPARHSRVSHEFDSAAPTLAAPGGCRQVQRTVPRLAVPRSMPLHFPEPGLAYGRQPATVLPARCSVSLVYSALRSPISRCNCSISLLSVSYSAILRLRNCTAMVALRSIPRGVSRYA